MKADDSLMVNNQRSLSNSQENARKQSNLSQMHSIVQRKSELHSILPQEHFSEHMVAGVHADLEGSVKGEAKVEGTPDEETEGDARERRSRR